MPLGAGLLRRWRQELGDQLADEHAAGRLSRPRHRLGRRIWPILALVVLACFLWQRSSFIEPRPSSIVTDRHGAFLAQLPSDAEGYGYWPVETVPDRVGAAILTLEDKRFWSHPGVDPLAILRAAKANLASVRRVSGASTIAMQLARLQHPEGRTYLSKGIEAATALLMTARY